MEPDKPKIYFPGLNGLRFVAAFAVIITHVELLKGQLGLDNNWLHPVIFNLGGLGVYFFFVLSGFLITYLLIAEKDNTGTISIKKFYIRRILRIWPLYYLLILLAFFVLPHFGFLDIEWLKGPFRENFWPLLVLNLFMLPNLALALDTRYPVPHAGQAWSIGVEEQFYLIWPVIVKFSRRFLVLLLVLTGGIVVAKAGILFLSEGHAHNSFIGVIKEFAAMSKIECMSIGAFGAYFLYTQNKRIMILVFNPLVQLLSYLMIPLLIYFTPELLQDGIHIVYSVIFCIIILNVAANQKSFLKMENRVFDFLGSISYGLYMYHMFIIVFVIRGLQYFGMENDLMANVMFYLFSVGLTIVVSWLSFRYFESLFNRKRKKFAKIISGNDAKIRE
ncbi:MAG: acyltransferase [Bacteroidota bacterium]